MKNNSESENQTAGASCRPSRFALCLSYNGSAYHGWQAQKSGLPTVEQALQSAVSKVANHPVELVCAGRTDKAVHASHQVVHFESHARRSPRSWVFGCNSNLPSGISVSWAGQVDDEFHARYSATRRRYHYVIFNHPVRPACFADAVTWHHYPLDAQRMHSAAQCLVGEHDFSSFRAVGCQSKSPFRFIEFIRVYRVANMVVLDIQGNAFLHHMVRNIAGVLMAIGSGRKPDSWCQQVLDARDRTAGGVTAPPHGLYLTHVTYPEQWGIPVSEGAPSIVQAMLVGAGHAPLQSDGLWDLAFAPE